MIMIFQASDVLLDLAADERSSNDRKSDFIVDNNMDGTGFLVDYGRNDSVSVGIDFFHYCFQIYFGFNI
jgi:hypothetical protein